MNWITKTVLKCLLILFVWFGGLAAGCMLSSENTSSLSLRCRVVNIEDGHATYANLTKEQAVFYKYDDVLWIDPIDHTVSESPDNTIVVQVVH